MGVIETLKNKVIVSCQAMPNEPLYREECMAAMMKSVLNGGAGGLRVAGVRDVQNAKKIKLQFLLMNQLRKIKII